MKTAILLCLVSISAVVLARPNQISTDSAFLKELDAAISEAHLQKDDPDTQQQVQVQDFNHTSEEVDDDDQHSLEHDDHHDHDDNDDDGHDFSHEDCDHSAESNESDEYHTTTPAQDAESTTKDQDFQLDQLIDVWEISRRMDCKDCIIHEDDNKALRGAISPNLDWDSYEFWEFEWA